MQETEKIWMNGELVAWADAKVHVLSHALHYGSGVFEGIRAYATDRGPAVFRLMDHLRRLERSSEVYFMQLPYSIEELRQATHEVIAANGLETCYVRPLAFRGYGELGINPLNCPVDVIIAVWPWGAYLGEEALEHGVRVMTSSWRRIGPNTLPATAKASGQYLNSQLAKMEAMHSGYDEAILLNEQGYLADGSGENVFMVQDGVLSTPPDDRVLPARHHARHRHPDRARHGLRGARDRRRAQRPLPRRRGLLHGHGRRDHADPLDRRARDRRRADHEAHPDRVLRDHHGPLRALARVPRLPRRRRPPRRERPGGAPDPALAARHRAARGGVRARRAALRHARRSARTRATSRRSSRPSAAASTPSPSRAARPGCTCWCAPPASARATRSSRRRSRSSPRPT